jgi:uncharacterized protein (TIGR02217 family)
MDEPTTGFSGGGVSPCRDVYTGVAGAGGAGTDQRLTNTPYGIGVGGGVPGGSAPGLSVAIPQPGSYCFVEALVFLDSGGSFGPVCTVNQGTQNSGTYDRMLYFDSTGRPIFYIWDGASKRAIGPAMTMDGKVHHLVGTADGSNIRLYVDGVLSATTATSNGGYTAYTTPRFMVTTIHTTPTQAGNFGGHVLLAHYGTACWSDREIAARARDPYGHLYNSFDFLTAALAQGSSVSVVNIASLVTSRGSMSANAAANAPVTARVTMRGVAAPGPAAMAAVAARVSAAMRLRPFLGRLLAIEARVAAAARQAPGPAPKATLEARVTAKFANSRPFLAITQAGIEVWRTGENSAGPTLAVTQVGAEIWRTGESAAQPNLAVTQFAVEVWHFYKPVEGEVTAQTGRSRFDLGHTIDPILIGPGWPEKKRAHFATRTHRSVSGRELRALDQGRPIWEWVLTYPDLRDNHDARANVHRDPGGWHLIERFRSIDPVSGHAAPDETADGAIIFQPGPALANDSDLRVMVGFFEAQQGGFGEFLYEDPSDNRVTGQLLDPGDGAATQFQLYRSLGGFVEPITAPKRVAHVYVNGVDPGNWTVDPRTGIVTFGSPPLSGAVLTADFTYFFRVKFSEDTQDFENFMLDLWQLGQVKLQSVP